MLQQLFPRGTVRAWRAELVRHGNAGIDAYFVPTDAQSLHGALAGQTGTAAQDVVAYLCEGTSCGPPLASLDALRTALSAQR